MASLLLVVFLVELAVHVVNTIGAASINNMLWTLYLMVPTRASKAAACKKKLQLEYLRIRQTINATSSQDEFARWAKLRRQHDKLQEQLEQLKTAQDATKSKFDSVIGFLRWTTTRGLQLVLPFWYNKQAMFWLPKGWFPYYIEWVLSFPRAPLGSVSILSWQMACSGVIMLVSDTITTVVGLVLGAPSQVPHDPLRYPAARGTREHTQLQASEKKQT